ncbi:hypothetical protein PT974_05967 [Cladobotryum mycophilum]|uniref:Uncharacterized protein n=1 Tax=Cladobotryum mycophilum TaxID=491253 RepID=A0ABR0SKI1_9HYPO
MALLLVSLAAKAIKGSRKKSEQDRNRNNDEQYFNDSYYNTQPPPVSNYPRNEPVYAPAPAPVTGHRRRRSRREDRIVGRTERILERRDYGGRNPAAPGMQQQQQQQQPANPPAPYQEYGNGRSENYYPNAQRPEQHNNYNNNNTYYRSGQQDRQRDNSNTYYTPPVGTPIPAASVPRGGGRSRRGSQDSDRPLDEPPAYDETVRRAKA